MTSPSIDGRRVLHWLGLLLLIVVVVPFVIYAVPGVVGAEGSYVVLSGSMEPSIGVGDVVVVDGVDPANIESGDVITYRRSGTETPTTHRVIEVIEGDGELAFVTQGDANDQPDASPVPASSVLGEVVVAIPYMGYVIDFVNTPAGFLALVVLPFLLLSISEIGSVLKNSRSERSESERSGSERSGSERSGPESNGEGGSEAVDNAPTDGEGSRLADDSVPKDDVEQAKDELTESVDGDVKGADTANGASMTVTRTDVRISLALLAGITTYAGWVVYNVQTAWSFAVAFASGAGLVLIGGMYYLAGNGSNEARDDPDVQAGGTPPESDGSGSVPGSKVPTDGSRPMPDEGTGDVANVRNAAAGDPDA